MFWWRSCCCCIHHLLFVHSWFSAATCFERSPVVRFEAKVQGQQKEERRRASGEREMAKEEGTRCQRIGCDALFTPDNNPEGSCHYHSGVWFCTLSVYLCLCLLFLLVIFAVWVVFLIFISDLDRFLAVEWNGMQCGHVSLPVFRRRFMRRWGFICLFSFCWQLLQLSVLIYTPCLCCGNCGDRSTNTWGVGKDAVQRKKKKTLAFGKYRGTGSSVYSYQKLCF